jgi:hypothetical protein
MAVLLHSGAVLVAGGIVDMTSSGTVYTNSAELYDPVTGHWSATGNLQTARSAVAVLLPSGKVMVAGGTDNTPSALASVEIYDPDTGLWSTTANMGWARIGHTITMLSNGKVLVVGGDVRCPNTMQPCDPDREDAEIYDPVIDHWSGAGKLNTMRRFHAATLLRNGLVLVAGGAAENCASSPSSCVYSSTPSAEIYDPVANIWVPAARMGTPRQSSLVVLHDGRVLTGGGANCSTLPTSALLGYPVVCDQLTNAEIYDPGTDKWTATGSMNKQHGEPLTLLCTGDVLVAAGYAPADSNGSAGSTFSAIAEIYDTSAGTWSLTGTMKAPRDETAVVELADGRVMITGGQSSTGYLALPEIFE